MYPHILTTSTVTMVIDNKQYSMTTDNNCFQKVVGKIKLGITDGMLELFSIKDRIKGDTFGQIVITQDDKLFYKDSEIHSTLTSTIITMYRTGFDISSMINFLENLMENPSQDSIDELYGFLEYGQMPITEDGHFLAYKKVRNDFKDCYSGEIDNSVGQFPEMDRVDVNSNKDQTCSDGLHFCSKEYLRVYDDNLPTVICKINPRDVVSIPSDYNNTKGRCCKYEVIAIYHDSHSEQFKKPVVDMNIIKMSVKQKMVYSYLKTYFKDELYPVDISEVDLVNFRDDYKVEYEYIINGICNLFSKEITRNHAVTYFKFMKDNFGVH